MSDYVKTVADTIIAQLREGTAPFIQPWKPGPRFMPYNPNSGRDYRGMNAVWLMMLGQMNVYGDARWMMGWTAPFDGIKVPEFGRWRPPQERNRP